MDFFTPIPEAQAIILTKGMYRQVPLFTRGGKVYAKIGTGFARLMQGGGTSSPASKWVETDVPEGVCVEKQGYLTYSAPKLVEAQ
jgi:hypothetical protein